MNRVSCCVRSLGNAPRMLLLALAVILTAANAYAVDPTLPDTGVSVDTFITTVVTKLGVTVAAVVGAYFAFLVIRKALRWSRTFAG